MAQRRGRGEGSIVQLCGPRYGCPEGRHKCVGPWRWTMDLPPDPDTGKRRRISKQAPTKRELLLTRADSMESLSLGVAPSTLTVGQWLDTWMQTAELKPYTRRGYESIIRNHLRPRLGAKLLQQLTAADIRGMVVALTDQGLSAQTISNVRTVLRRALTIAERDRLVRYNAATHVELPKVQINPHPILTAEQARRVIDCTEDMGERARIMMALMAGLRQAEALGLRWGDLDLDAGTITIRRTVARVKRAWVITTPKSAKSWRTFPIAGALRETLALVRGDAGDDDWVFPNPERPTEPVMPAADYKAWKAACRRAGVSGVPLHGARGTLETMLIHAGVTMTDSAAMLGHDPVTAARHYARATQESQAALAGTVEALMRGPD